MEERLFKAYKERVIKLSTRDTAVRCTKSSLKRKVFDFTKLNKDTVNNILNNVFNGITSPIKIDCNSFDLEEINTKISNINDTINTLVDNHNKTNEEDEDTSHLYIKQLKELQDKLDELNKRRLNIINSGIRQIINIGKESSNIQKQNGTYTLYLGYRFISGMVDGKTVINAPLFLIPMSIEYKHTRNNVVLKLNSNRSVILNTKILILLESMCAIKCLDIPSAEEVLKSTLHKGILFGDSIYVKEITYDSITPISEKATSLYNMTIYNAAGLGIYNVSTSIYNDYVKLEDREPNALIYNLFNSVVSVSSNIQYKNNMENLAYRPHDLYLISKLDSSQECAVYMADKNNGLVIFGPPGTGKSQVITNIVANNLATNKRILIVSEKKTALDVVHNRLGLLNKYAMILKDSGDIVGFRDKITTTANSYLTILPDTSNQRINILDAIENKLNTLQNIYQYFCAEAGKSGISMSDLYKLCRNSSSEELISKLIEDNSGILDITLVKLNETLDSIDEDMIKCYSNNVVSLDEDILSKSVLQLKLLLNNIYKYQKIKNELKYEPSYYSMLITKCKDIIDKLSICAKEYGEILDSQYSYAGSVPTKIDIDNLWAYTNELINVKETKLNGCKYTNVDEVKNNIEQECHDKFPEYFDKIKYYTELLKKLQELDYNMHYINIEEYDLDDTQIDKYIDIINYSMNNLKVIQNRYNIQYTLEFNQYGSFIKNQLSNEFSGILYKINSMIAEFYNKSYLSRDITEDEYRDYISNIDSYAFKPNKLFKNYNKINSENQIILNSLVKYIQDYIRIEMNNISNKIWANSNNLKNLNFNYVNSINDLERTCCIIKAYIERMLEITVIELGKLRKDLHDSFVNDINTIDNYNDTINKLTDKMCKLLNCDSCNIVDMISKIKNNYMNLVETYKIELEDCNKIYTELLELKNTNIEGLIDKENQIKFIINNHDTIRRICKLNNTERYILKLLKTYSKEDIINSYIAICLDNNKVNEIDRYDKLVKDVNKLEDESVKLNISTIDYIVNNSIIDKLSSCNQSIVELTRYLTSKKDRGISIKEAINQYNHLLNILYPVWMLTPETVSDILPLVSEDFDIVIFDEASQMFIEKAVPSLYRAKKAIIAGDDKQLRPSRFFETNALTEEAEEILEESIGKDVSLLDQAKVSFNSVNLMFHYRAKYAELIQFSNHAFYNSLLKLAPNISRLNKSDTLPIVYKNVHGIKKDGVNDKEATEVVSIVKDLLLHTNYTIGIITLNSNQRDYIENKLDELAAKKDEYKFAALLTKERNRMENNEDISLFVKSIEDVQGDERDVIIISVDRGYDEHGKLLASLGPIAVEGGENRLNVAISRAKCREYVITSLEPEQFNVEGSKNSGPKLFRDFLVYARAVSNNNIEEVDAIVNSGNQIVKNNKFDSPFEEQVYFELKNLGWDVETQVGVRGYRIDLAVYDAELGKYIAGIECDGATYHSSKNARERDISRQRFLESHGWNILRIWSSNWWKNSKAEINRIHNEILKLRDSITCETEETIVEKEVDLAQLNEVEIENNEDSLTMILSDYNLWDVTNVVDLMNCTKEDVKNKKLRGIIINNKDYVEAKYWHNVVSIILKCALETLNKEYIILSLGDKNFIETSCEKLNKPVKVEKDLYFDSKLDAFNLIQRAKLVSALDNKNSFRILICDKTSLNSNLKHNSVIDDYYMYADDTLF